MEKICAKCGEVKSDCMVTINDSIKCERQILCSGCPFHLRREMQRLFLPLWIWFLKATDTKTAGGGLMDTSSCWSLLLGRWLKIMATTLQLNGCSWSWKK